MSLSDHDIQVLSQKWGIDLAMLERNLEMSVDERAQAHHEALLLKIEMEAAREELDT